MLVIGGGPAGLGAALQVARQQRSVIVVDAGEPRNAPAAHVHGSLGLDGAAPAELTGRDRDEVRSHGGEVLAGRVLDVARDPDAVDRAASGVAVGAVFRAELTGGHTVLARKVVLATGLVDELPDIDGEVVAVDATGATSVPGVWAAGNVADPGQQVPDAAAHGTRVGAMVARSLAHDDAAPVESGPVDAGPVDTGPVGAGSADTGADGPAPVRRSANEADWDRRYGGERIWSGNPNGTLVAEVAGLAPGRALDVGAGEGGDALWLAEQGWQVTASDVSGLALAGIRSEAARRGAPVADRVETLHADANALAAFPAGAFDLVVAFYASIPRTVDDRALANVLGAVAPGGTLLVVGHDLTPMRAPVDTRTTSRMFDPDGFVTVDAFAARLAAADAASDWEVETHETRARPAGAASASHYVDDVVFRARRR